MVGDVHHITGGYDDDNYLTSILAWDPDTEDWREVGDLAVARSSLATVEVPSTAVSDGLG